jgi:hypothetical protein
MPAFSAGLFLSGATTVNTPLTDLSNAAIYGGPEINWNRTISTMITGGFTYMDHQDVPFVEAFPAYLNFPALGGRMTAGLGVKVDFNLTHHHTIFDAFAEGCYIGRRVSLCGILGREGPIEHYFDLDQVAEGSTDPPMPLYGIMTLRVITSSGSIETSH